MNTPEKKTPPCLYPASRQYQHNDCSGLLHGFDYDETVSLVRDFQKQIRRLQKAIRRKNRLIHRLRYDNPNFRKWCYLYWGEQKNPWVKNIGELPKSMPHDAWIDIILVDGHQFKRRYAVSLFWSLSSMRQDIEAWRFHNSMGKNGSDR